MLPVPGSAGRFEHGHSTGLKRNGMKCVIVLLCLAVIVLPSPGQTVQPEVQPSVQPPSRIGTPTTRSIEGTVVTKEGAPVAGAIVLLKDTKTLQVRSFIAQKDGRYHFYGLSSDINYQVRAEAGDRTSPIKNISVFDSHKIITVNLKLKKKKKA